MDLRQSREYTNFLQEIDWIVEKKSGCYFFIKKIPLLGSAIKLQRTKKISFNDLEKLSKKYRAFQLIIEPEKGVKIEALIQKGFKISKAPFLPTKTLQIDITKSKKEILSQMKKDGRYSLKKAADEEIVLQNSIEKFRSDWAKVVGRKRHVLPLLHLKAFKKSFGENMTLFQNKNGTAGGMFLKSNDTSYYWIGYTDLNARKSLVQYKIVWSGILWAKKRGAKIFDFEGIYDSRFPIESWKGFTHFKKSFGGKEVIYPGSFTKLRIPFNF